LRDAAADPGVIGNGVMRRIAQHVDAPGDRKLGLSKGNARTDNDAMG
jgi:hypothetical protein